MKIANFFYTSGQAAKLLGVTRITIWRWAKSGKFNPQYIGREALIPKWEVDLFLESRGRNEVN
jgi:excisionase family DNA binding protein